MWSIFINMQIEIWCKTDSWLLLGAAQSPPKPLVPNSSPAWHLWSQFYGPGMGKVSVSCPFCSGEIKPKPLSQIHILGTVSAHRGGTSPLTWMERQLHPKRCQHGWAGHPFCRQARGCEHAKNKICLFSTSTGLWTLWWVSSAINTSLKCRCLLDRGLRKLKRRLGGLGWISQVVYAKPSQWVTSQSAKSYHQCSKSFHPRPCPPKERQWLKWKREPLTCVIQRQQEEASKTLLKIQLNWRHLSHRNIFNVNEGYLASSKLLRYWLIL